MSDAMQMAVDLVRAFNPWIMLLLVVQTILFAFVYHSWRKSHRGTSCLKFFGENINRAFVIAIATTLGAELLIMQFNFHVYPEMFLPERKPLSVRVVRDEIPWDTYPTHRWKTVWRIETRVLDVSLFHGFEQIRDWSGGIWYDTEHEANAAWLHSVGGISDDAYDAMVSRYDGYPPRSRRPIPVNVPPPDGEAFIKQ